MLAVVVFENGPRKVAEDFESCLGKFKVGDIWYYVLLDVRKLEPMSLGSSHYIYTDTGNTLIPFPSSSKIFVSARCKSAPKKSITHAVPHALERPQVRTQAQCRFLRQTTRKQGATPCDIMPRGKREPGF